MSGPPVIQVEGGYNVRRPAAGLLVVSMYPPRRDPPPRPRPWRMPESRVHFDFEVGGTGPRLVGVRFELVRSTLDFESGERVPYNEGRALVHGVKLPTTAQLERLARQAEAVAADALAHPRDAMDGPHGVTDITPVRELLDVRPRRRLITDGLLRDVARLYREALAEGRPPRVHIAERLVASRSTVATWVGLARRRVDPATGDTFLGPATGTRPGEAKTTRKGRKR